MASQGHSRSNILGSLESR